jgi:hypothetical protein
MNGNKRRAMIAYHNALNIASHEHSAVKAHNPAFGGRRDHAHAAPCSNDLLCHRVLSAREVVTKALVSQRKLERNPQLNNIKRT